MKRTILFLVFGVAVAGAGYLFFRNHDSAAEPVMEENLTGGAADENLQAETPYPLTIAAVRQGQYPGSELTVVEKLPDKPAYSQTVVSYLSENLAIRALLTVPRGVRPAGGWPVIVFNHGYIPPGQYRTTERYVAYVDYFARNGYIVFKSDYRGHGESEGEAVGGYGSNAYTIDVLNAVASVKKLPEADPARIGMWGHSMGGHITLRVMVTTGDVKAGVIWAGVVASYPELLTSWRRRAVSPPAALPTRARRWRDELVERFGAPDVNPEFWNSVCQAEYYGMQ